MYQYKCKHKACGQEFEEMEIISKRKTTQVCPKCKRLSGKLFIPLISSTPDKWGDTPRGGKTGLGRYAG